MANAMPNMNPLAMGQNNALSMAQRQAQGGITQMNGNNPSFATLAHQRQFQHQQMMQQHQLQLQQFPQQQQQQQQDQQHQQQQQPHTPVMNNFQLQQPSQQPTSDSSGTSIDPSKANPPITSQQPNSDMADDFGLDSFVDFTEMGPASSTPSKGADGG
ncbi:hypothetical protein BGZ65_000905, partial [Modicella reniformis]